MQEYTEYVILIAFPRQLVSRTRLSVRFIRTLPVLFLLIRVTCSHRRLWRIAWMILAEGNRSYRSKTFPNATLFTTNSISTGLSLNFGLHGQRTVTKCWSHGMALKFILLHILVSYTPSSELLKNHMFYARLLSVVTCVIEYTMHTVFYNVTHNYRNNIL
jgi:hypothetical protein